MNDIKIINFVETDFSLWNYLSSCSNVRCGKTQVAIIFLEEERIFAIS